MKYNPLLQSWPEPFNCLLSRTGTVGKLTDYLAYMPVQLREAQEVLTIQTCISELLKNETTDAMVEAAAQVKRPTITKAEFRTTIQSFSDHLKENKLQQAVASMLALLLVDADTAIFALRRKGVLRASRCKFRSGCIETVIGAALQLVPFLQVRPDRVTYLKSVQALLTLAPQAMQIRESLVLRMSNRKDTVIKTLLVAVNAAFSNGWVGNRLEDSGNLAHWSAEEFASTFSFLFVLFREEIGIFKEMWQRTDEQCIKPLESVYASLLIDAAKLYKLLDAETLIDGLPYQASVDGSTVTVSSVDPNLEKSIRLGYIQTDQQIAIRAHGIAQAWKEKSIGFPLIKDFIQRAFAAGMGRLVEFRAEPVPRLVFAMPNTTEFFSPLITDQLFLEEFAMLYEVGIENFKLEEGVSLRVSEKLSVLDVIKVQRLFSFIDAVLVEKLKAISDEHLRESLTVSSTIPVIRSDQFIQLLEKILLKEKVQDVLKLLTLEGNEDYVDIQYRPFIKAGEWYAIPPAVVGKSNLVRNIVLANRLKTSAAMMQDPMQEAVVKALTQAGFMVRANFNFNMDGDRETDILCWRDGELFVFECKNSYHPCSPHELRTSFEHLRTAEQQLDVRLAWLTSAANQAKLLKWLSWQVPATQKVHTGIITANRAFTGYSLGAHPVRQAHELINVLLRGHVGRAAGQAPLKFWHDEHFHASDLVDYLGGQAIVGLQYRLLQPFARCIRIGEMTLSFANYTMNLHDAAEAMEQEFGIPGATEITPLK